MIRFNAEGVCGLRDQPRSGRPARMPEGQQATLKAIVLRGPDPQRDGVSAWRIIDLCRIAEERFGISYREGGMRRLIKSLGLSWQKTRPHTPKRTRPRRSDSKRGPRPRTERSRPMPSRCTGAALVSGRSPGRTEGPRRPSLVRVRDAP